MKLSMKQKQTQRYERGNLWLPGEDGEGRMIGGLGLADASYHAENGWTTKSSCIIQETVFNILW